MSETQKYNLVEEYKLDTWLFLTVMAVLATVAPVSYTHLTLPTS